jgi:DNA-binding NtrC family response regulator
MLKKITILILDAEKNSCVEMQEFLHREGFIVHAAHSADEGLIELKNQPIDILIIDIRLPDANGLDLIKEYRASYPKLEVIVISGHGDMDSVIQAMHLGVLDFLRRPLRLMDLLSAINRSLKFQNNGGNIYLPNEKGSMPSFPMPN